MKFAHIDMDVQFGDPVVWDAVPKDDMDLVLKAKGLYERCRMYSGRNIHDVNGAAGGLLNNSDHLLFAYTSKMLKPGAMDDLDETYAKEGGWKGHTRKSLKQACERAVKALAE